MEDMKFQLERQLIANVIKDKCAKCPDILFSESWCTKERCIRFTLPILRAIFPPKQNCGGWDTGDFVMFEVNNSADKFEVVLSVSKKGLPKECVKDFETLEKSFDSSLQTLWQCLALQPKDIFEFFDDFLNKKLPEIQKQILKVYIPIIKEEVLEEGTVKSITSTRYERNRKARELCLSYYGKTCTRCGLNFEKDFGTEYANVIEVHHIVPISEIGESYVVNPIKDLVPLCPNCHAMTHVEIKQKG